MKAQMSPCMETTGGIEAPDRYSEGALKKNEIAEVV